MSDNLTDLSQQLNDTSEKKQLAAIAQLADTGESGWQILLDYLGQNAPLQTPKLAVGSAYQTPTQFAARGFKHSTLANLSHGDFSAGIVPKCGLSPPPNRFSQPSL